MWCHDLETWMRQRSHYLSWLLYWPTRGNFISPARVLISEERRTYTLEILAFTCPEETHMDSLCICWQCKKWVKASLANWIGSFMANRGHICMNFSGFNFCPPRFPTLGAWFTLQAIPMCDEANFSLLAWKACRRNWTHWDFSINHGG